MTLKEKFRKYCTTSVSINQDQSEYTESKYTEECVDIAEEFAIGFAEWLIEKEREHPNRIIRGKQLLEIYKKEKGL
jgi:hypothetical protein